MTKILVKLTADPVNDLSLENKVGPPYWAKHLNWTFVECLQCVHTLSERRVDVHLMSRRNLGVVPSGSGQRS